MVDAEIYHIEPEAASVNSRHLIYRESDSRLPPGKCGKLNNAFFFCVYVCVFYEIYGLLIDILLCGRNIPYVPDVAFAQETAPVLLSPLRRTGAATELRVPMRLVSHTSPYFSLCFNFVHAKLFAVTHQSSACLSMY